MTVRYSGAPLAIQAAAIARWSRSVSSHALMPGIRSASPAGVAASGRAGCESWGTVLIVAGSCDNSAEPASGRRDQLYRREVADPPATRAPASVGLPPNWGTPDGPPLHGVGNRAFTTTGCCSSSTASQAPRCHLVATSTPEKPEHTVDTAADVLWLAMKVRNYDWLVRQRGWPPECFQRWYVDIVAAALLTAPESPTPVERLIRCTPIGMVRPLAQPTSTDCDGCRSGRPRTIRGMTAHLAA